MNWLVRKILKVLQENQHLEEMNKMKDNIIANMEETIKRLGEESKCIKERKAIYGAMCILLVSIFIFSVDM